MSKLETPMTRAYWETVGGTLVEEFCAVNRSNTCGQRLIDGVILPNLETKIVKATDFDKNIIEGEKIIIVQTKAARLGMNVLGQAFFSAELMKRFNPKSILSVALVIESDSVLQPIFESFPNMKIVVINNDNIIVR